MRPLLKAFFRTTDSMGFSRRLLFDDVGVSLPNVHLTFTAVPEPITLVLAGLGAALEPGPPAART